MGTQRSQCSDTDRARKPWPRAFFHMNANNLSRWTDRIWVVLFLFFLQDAAAVHKGRILLTPQVLLGTISLLSIYNAGAGPVIQCIEATDLFKCSKKL